MKIMDNVKCLNCEFDGLIEYCEERCPQCKKEGALIWKDDEEQEVVVY